MCYHLVSYCCLNHQMSHCPSSVLWSMTSLRYGCSNPQWCYARLLLCHSNVSSTTRCHARLSMLCYGSTRLKYPCLPLWWLW